MCAWWEVVAIVDDHIHASEGEADAGNLRRRLGVCSEGLHARRGGEELLGASDDGGHDVEAPDLGLREEVVPYLQALPLGEPDLCDVPCAASDRVEEC